MPTRKTKTKTNTNTGTKKSTTRKTTTKKPEVTKSTGDLLLGDISYRGKVVPKLMLHDKIVTDEIMAEKVTGGRDLLYTPQELKDHADEYFDKCRDIIYDKGMNGKVHKPFTISGINLYLGVSKNYLSEKYKCDDFLGTVEYIRRTIENDVEEKALVGIYSPGASSFNLKNNFGWTEKTEITEPVQMAKMKRENQELIDKLMD